MKLPKTKQPMRREAQNLDVRYGEIGISAVAAAMRFQGEGKNPGPAAGEPKSGQWSGQWSGLRHDRWHEDAFPEFAA